MARTRKTGDEMVRIIFAAPYDPHFLNGYFVSLVGKIADGQTHRPAKAAAREALEPLADPDTFLAANPGARKRGA